MGSHLTRRTDGRLAKLTPRIEGLEERLALSTVTANGAALSIIGTAAKDVLKIEDFNANGVQTIRVTDDKPGTRNDRVSTFTNITSISVDAKGGDDTVTYTLSRPLTAARSMNLSLIAGTGNDTVSVSVGQNAVGANSNLSISGDLGSGDDKYTLTVLGGGAIGAGATLRSSVQGGSGKDKLTVTTPLQINTGVFPFQLTGPEIAPNATVDLNFDGGLNDDTINVAYSGKLRGRLLLNLQGGSGKDNVTANVNATAGSNGKVGDVGQTAQVLGGLNDDKLRFAVTFNPNDNSNILVAGHASGDAGTDVVQHSITVQGDPSNETDQVIA